MSSRNFADLLPEETEFTKEVVVMSEWITVHHNEYTNVDTLHESGTYNECNLNGHQTAKSRRA